MIKALTYQRVAISGAACCILMYCGLACADPQPTASEIFYLRGECQRLGEELMKDDFAGPHWTSPHLQTNYNFKDNRCYMTISRSTSYEGQKAGMDCTSIALYEVQTKDMLAYANNGQCLYGIMQYQRTKHGTIFDDTYSTIREAEEDSFDYTLRYVNSKMH